MAAKSPIDEGRARQWVRETPTWRQRFFRAFWHWWYQRIPRLVGAEFTVKSLALGLLPLLPLAGIATSPFWTDFVLHRQLPWMTAAILSGALLLLMLVQFLLERFLYARGRKDAQQRHVEKFATRLYVIMNELAPGFSLDQLGVGHKEALHLCEKVLQCAAHLTRGHLSKPDVSYYQVSLLLFSDPGGEQMQIAARSTPDRPSRIIESRRTIAYYVARAGCSFVVDDMKRQSIFPKEGLSEKSLRYRSILFLPVFRDGETSHCCGVVTIDSARAYEFTGLIADQMETQLRPLLRVLSVLVGSQAHWLEIEQ